MDRFGRHVRHLRISVTDQCNFRCLYCLPPEGLPTLPRDDLLTPDEMARFAQSSVDLGIDRIRLTGGEPLLRPEIVDIVAKLSAIQGLHDLALTTNGSRLKKRARSLRQAGLKRLNISLDSLNKNTFEKIALRTDFAEVMDGVLTSLAEGFPVKINAVIMRGINDHEMEDFVEFALANPLAEMRFIEFMPLCGTGWRPELVFPFTDFVQKMQARWTVEPIFSETGTVATSYAVSDGQRHATIGLITTLSRPFCNQCSRIRLSCDGVIRPCLFSHTGIPVREVLRNGAPDSEIGERIRAAVDVKPAGNEFAAAHAAGESFDSIVAKRQGHAREQNPSIHFIGG
jgi:cyclic pyranopterin phosphate synthase